MRTQAIWWLLPAECEYARLVFVANGPEYIKRQLASLAGRNPRGRLWADERFRDDYVEESLFKSPLGQLCADRGGIVIDRRDIALVQHLPGFVTNYSLNTLRAQNGETT